VTYFFDTSALVKRYHPEVGSSTVEAMFREHNRRIIMSRLTVVELQSALALKVRTGQLNERSSASLRLRALDDVGTGTVTVVSVKDMHYAAAARLIVQHGSVKGLRTLDALQLAVALEAHDLGGLDVLVAADKTLCEVAALEGLSVLNPEHP
jgi:predicted nucleic acid-binding protein